MAKFIPPLMALAMAMTSTSSNGETASQNPLHLVVEETGTMVEIRVVGESPKPVQLKYEILFEGDSRTRNSGSIRMIAGGEPKTVATLRMSSKGPWTAKMRVTGDLSYEESVSGPSS